MTSASTITNADDRRLALLVTQARTRVVFVAPGISVVVAQAISDAWPRLGAAGLTVILDVDPEVCRLGYGTLEGLKAVREAATAVGGLVCHQPGLRIGLLIADDRTLVYSPTPLLIEAGSDAPDRPNAIELGPPPADVAQDLGIGPRGDRDRRIGLDPVDPRRVEAVTRDLEAAPPVKFDLARRVRVFTSRFQFVEMEMTGCFISRKRVPIPSSLVGLASKQDVERQFHAHFDLVQSGRLEVKSGDQVITERVLLDQRRDIEKRFLVSLPGYGTVVLRGNKDKLIKAVDELRAQVVAFSKGIKAQLNDIITKGRSTVVEALLPAVERNPPDQCTKTLGPRPNRGAVATMLDDDIQRAFGSAEALVKDMQVKLVFKDVAYESLVDTKFVETARKAMPHVEFLHEEYEAAAADRQGGTA
ncbi:MAG: hypothetical protein AB7F89_03945 [Pirellulaceae bacterium]